MGKKVVKPIQNYYQITRKEQLGAEYHFFRAMKTSQKDMPTNKQKEIKDITENLKEQLKKESK